MANIIDTQKPKVSIQFLGAVGTVTGSKYFIQTPTKNILVDCGLFQGLKELRLLNWNPLPIDTASIDVVLLTHGHLDHCGYLPRLVKEGFEGEIWGTGPTLEIAKIILEDSARIQEEDADKANAEKFSKHHPAKPLYDTDDVKKTVPHFVPKPLDQWIEIDIGLYCRYNYNGHILGATFIELKVGEKIIVFSGDIGREEDVLMFAPHKPEHADVVLIESTYGDRLHPDNAENKLADLINKSALKHGTIVIPSFAVERTQSLMYILWKLRKKGAIPDIPVYMDSPMGTNVLDVFDHNSKWHKLSKEDTHEMCKDIIQIKTIKETYKLADSIESKIIIAGSGIASGGRVLTYLLQYIGKPSATVMLVGFQAEGTRGRALLEGAKEIKLYGKFYPVKAEIINVEGLSSHADQAGLINWLSALKEKPSEIFIVHGESNSSKGLQEKIQSVYGWTSSMPKLNQKSEV